MSAPAPSFGLVVPTLGRPSLQRTLAGLAAAAEAAELVVLVDDRPGPDAPLEVPEALAARTVVLRGGGRGPAAARNLGWRALGADWAVFLDDDVVPGEGWADALRADLAAAPADVAGIQGRIVVPLPETRRPTDWERNVAGLAHAAYITADMAYRTDILDACGGFDERFPRAYREDADLALRVLGRGRRIVRGSRVTAHPVGPSDAFTSVRLQRGNADDARMRRVHGRRWRQRALAGPGRNGRHALVVAGALAGLAGALARRPRLLAAGALAAGAGEAELCWARIAPGPRTSREIARMLMTSLAIPFAATAHRLAGEVRVRREGAAGRAPWQPPPGPAAPLDTVLFDRDGTLVEDVPYNADPDRVVPVAGARAGLERLRAAGLRLGIVTNQSGLARGLFDEADLCAVHRRVEDHLGRFDTWQVCPHGPSDACGCRKPAPGLVEAACRALRTVPARTVVVGDIGADIAAALAAGAGAVLVPTKATRATEIVEAPAVTGSLPAAASLVLAARRHGLGLGRRGGRTLRPGASR